MRSSLTEIEDCPCGSRCPARRERSRRTSGRDDRAGLPTACRLKTSDQRRERTRPELHQGYLVVVVASSWRLCEIDQAGEVIGPEAYEDTTGEASTGVCTEAEVVFTSICLGLASGRLFRVILRMPWLSLASTCSGIMASGR